MLEQYSNSGNSSDPNIAKFKTQMLSALAHTRDKSKIKRLLEMVFKPGRLENSSDAMPVLQHLSTNSAATETVLQYFVDHYSEITARYGNASPITATANAMAPHLKSLGGLFLVCWNFYLEANLLKGKLIK